MGEKSKKIIILSAAAAIAVTVGAAGILFVRQVKAPIVIQPLTAEISLDEEKVEKEQRFYRWEEEEITLLKTEDDGTFELGAMINMSSDVQKGLVPMPAEKTVWGFYTCRAEYEILPFEPQITFSSSDESVASVDEKGTVTMGQKGRCVITVEADGIKLEIPLKICERVYADGMPRSITINRKESRGLIKTGEFEILSCKFYSSDKNIVSVNEQGVITALKPGTAYVYGTLQNGERKTTSVKVLQYVESVSVSNITMIRGTSAKVFYSLYPADCNRGTAVTYTVDDSSIASVDASGKVNGLKAGTTRIIVTTEYGITAAAAITVQEPVKSRATIDYTTPEEMAALGRYYSFTDVPAAYASLLKITFDQTVTDFCFSHLAVSFDDTSMIIDTASTPYTVGTIEAGMPIILSADITGDVIPTKGISYVDTDGRRVYYYLYQSGKDGRAMLARY